MPGPRRVPRVTQRSVEPVGCSPNLASMVSFRIFSHTVKKEALRAGAGPLLTNPWLGPCGKDMRYPGRVGLITTPRSSCTFRAVGSHRVMGPWWAGSCTHINPLSQKVLQHLATQQPQLHRGLEEALYQLD